MIITEDLIYFLQIEYPHMHQIFVRIYL